MYSILPSLKENWPPGLDRQEIFLEENGLTGQSQKERELWLIMEHALMMGLLIHKYQVSLGQGNITKCWTYAKETIWWKCFQDYDDKNNKHACWNMLVCVREYMCSKKYTGIKILAAFRIIRLRIKFSKQQIACNAWFPISDDPPLFFKNILTIELS